MAGSDPPESNAGGSARSGNERSVFRRVAAIGRNADIAATRWGPLLAIAMHLGGASLSVLSLNDIADFAAAVQARVDSQLDSMLDIDIAEPEPEPIPEPEPEPIPEPEPEPIPEPEPTAEPEPLEEPQPTEQPAPAAAESGKVLTSEPDPEEPLDLTNTIISGSGDRFAGGISAADGKAKDAVRTRRATAGGVVGGTGTAPNTPKATPTVDRSRPAGLSLAENWSGCPFPPEADAEQQNEAVVRLVVTVGPDGRAKSVTVVDDPGYGFGRAARRCAMPKTFTPGLDRNGAPTTSTTPPFRVRFRR